MKMHKNYTFLTVHNNMINHSALVLGMTPVWRRSRARVNPAALAGRFIVWLGIFITVSRVRRRVPAPLAGEGCPPPGPLVQPPVRERASESRERPAHPSPFDHHPPLPPYAPDRRRTARFPAKMANMARDLLKEQYQYAYDKDREQLNYQVNGSNAENGARDDLMARFYDSNVFCVFGYVCQVW